MAIIAVDFDGTCVTHEYPRIGKDIGAAPVLRKLVENGHHLILYTMRGHFMDDKEYDHSNVRNPDDEYSEAPSCDALQEAVDWFDRNNIPLWHVNENPEQKKWTSSQKLYANCFIDDAALGVPLIRNPEMSKRPYVDWVAVEALLKEKGWIRE
ncbi:MAG: hypothetical protein II940_00600 [Methanosarcinaceae archaeon]|nr:hypothetical protein [Methanosarcinaceae archaeon]